MPLIRVELFDYRMSDETSAALIEKLTDALGEATHPGLKEHTWVIVEGHNPKNWGLGREAVARRPDATCAVAVGSSHTTRRPACQSSR
jgi:phenylpyruvate tautomerase PptA (4-oxalocrotonate tautomerase family)